MQMLTYMEVVANLISTSSAIIQLDIHVWDYLVDNDFAFKIIDAGDSPALEPFSHGKTEQLCDSCKDLDFWTTGFHIEDDLSELKVRQENCQFCSMRWEACKYLEGYSPSARFDRIDSVMKLNESDPPVFSICSGPGLNLPASLQVGLPQVTEAARTPYQIRLINTWIKECDENHPKCRGLPQKDGPGSRKAFQLPTRLIDIGQPGSKIKLYETQPDDKTENLKYIALSHQWGDPTASNHFRTTTQNYAAHLINIDFYKLPDTFKDAVTMTRDMGIRYLWIDSICIIQGPDGDFNTESQKMEDVFSSAYCVIAASCARDQWDGFLKNRLESDSRRFATFRNGRDPPFYVCQFLDDFNADVLEGPLNKRGWVLQERVLARRTIFFTDKQIYWECGKGVRCETLTHMKNELAAFLGDPNFPEIAIHSPRADRDTSHGEKILYYQDLYKTYSRLAFSKPEDRGVAMNGLEQRLSRGFVCNGKFGILDDKSLFHRGLLWRRAVTVTSMEKILFPADRQQVPSWSWMAVKGEMDYIPVPFGTVDWETSLKSPLRHTLTFKDEQSRTMEIRAKANELVPGHGDDLEEFYDRVSDHEGTPRKVLCVVVGINKGSGRAEEKFHFVLLVSPKPSSGPWVCERVGAGKVPGSWIDFTRPAADIGIC
ncbi:Protein kinase domain-containing protein [Fusarium keratoplasticum]|nr:Protein kinase domain-containing protein [Fusarium keratoplasticum]